MYNGVVCVQLMRAAANQPNRVIALFFFLNLGVWPACPQC